MPSQKEMEATDKYTVAQTRLLLQAAKKVADSVYLVPQPIAFDEHEHPKVAERWTWLFPVGKKKESFVSNKSIANRRRRQNRLMAAVAREMQVSVVDLDGYMRKMLPTRYDLFSDQWHFSPEGAALAAEFVAEGLIPMLQPGPANR